MIDRLIAGSAPDAELFYYRGLADLFSGRSDEGQRAERYAAAHGWFARAVAADPAHYTALYRLAATTPVSAGASKDVTRQLVNAHELAPLMGDIAIDAATALAAERRYAEAESAILPIAINPHGGNMARAQALLDSIRQQAASSR